jgi:hypothetical protein
MGYNVLSGSTSVINATVSGAFIGDGSQLDNVTQFPLQNASVTRIPFYKTIDSELGLNANDGLTFNVTNNALTVPGLTSSVGIRLSNPVSGALASTGSYLGLDANGNIVVTSSVGGGEGTISYSRRFITSSATASINDTLIGVSASAALQLRLAPAQTYTEGQYFIVKDEGGNANSYNIAILCSGSQTIDGTSSVILESPFAAVNIYSNGLDKFFIY